MARVNEFTDLATVIEVMEVKDCLKDAKICITGHLGRPRQDIEKLIRTAGGEVHTSIKWSTTHLLTNADWTAGSTHGGSVGKKKVSSKYAEACRYKVKIISEKDFYDILCR